MTDERSAGQDPEQAEEVLDPAPGGLARPGPPPAQQRPNGAVDGIVDLAGRVLTPFVRLGWRGARRVGRDLGVNDAVSRRVDRALDSETADQAAERVLESEASRRVWSKVLESEQIQQTIERVTEAPELRTAITSQGVGLLEDVRRTARRLARRLDDGADRSLRRLLRRSPRAERPIYAGGATRLLAIVLDGALLSGILLLISTLLALLANALFSLDGNSDTATIAFGALAWWAAGGIYLGSFWILAERTPGMTFLGLRISNERGARVGPRQDVRRLLGFALALIPFGLGFLGILTNERRRGWHDRFAGTVVLYADPELDSELPGWTPPPAIDKR